MWLIVDDSCEELKQKLPAADVSLPDTAVADDIIIYCHVWNFTAKWGQNALKLQNIIMVKIPSILHSNIWISLMEAADHIPGNLCCYGSCNRCPHFLDENDQSSLYEYLEYIVLKKKNVRLLFQIKSCSTGIWSLWVVQLILNQTTHVIHIQKPYTYCP